MSMARPSSASWVAQLQGPGSREGSVPFSVPPCRTSAAEALAASQGTVGCPSSSTATCVPRPKGIGKGGVGGGGWGLGAAQRAATDVSGAFSAVLGAAPPRTASSRAVVRLDAGSNGAGARQTTL